MIDFESSASHLLLNPRLPAGDRRRYEMLAAAAPFAAHVFIASSGTTGAVKLVALSKAAILTSAAAVNERLGITRDDVWCSVLPPFHVGGLGVYARAHLAGSRVVPIDWDPDRFVNRCAEDGVTVASLVPTQVHDLVAAAARAPQSLRAILVGGGAFDAQLNRDARALGWPVLASYGMTECCSTVAAATLESDELTLLNHVEARTERDGRLALRSPSLFTTYIVDDGGVAMLADPKTDGWFVSEDLGEVRGRTISVAGRRGDFVKIGGESVDLLRLDGIINRISRELHGDAAVIAVHEARLGHVIHLAVAGGDAAAIATAFNDAVLPFERARAVHRVTAIPRTALGKLMRGALLALVNDEVVNG